MNRKSSCNKKSLPYLKQVVKSLSQSYSHIFSFRRLGWLTGSTLLLFAASNSPVAAQTQTTIVNQTFKGDTAFGWQSQGLDNSAKSGSIACLTAQGTSPSGSIPNCNPSPNDPSGSGALRLTTANQNQQSYAFYDFPIPANVPLTISFTTFVYGGTTQNPGPNGADGISFFLFDATTSATNINPGGFGGSLGYAQRTDLTNGNIIDPGIPNAYVGVGVDEFGNFLDDQESRGTGCGTGAYTAYQPIPGQPTTNQPNTVTIRGPGNGTQGYCYLGSSYPTPLTLTSPPRTPTTSQGKNVQIIYTPTGSGSQVSISVDGVVTTVTIPQPPSSTSFKLGFASSTGGFTNIHEIQNLKVTALTSVLPNLTITKIHTPTSVSAGRQNIPYTLSVKNTGAANTTGPVTITDTLPAGFSFATPVTTSANWFCNPPSGQVIQCTYSAIIPANGAASDLVLNVNVLPTTVPGPTYVNTATVPQDGVTSTPNDPKATDNTPVIGPVSALKTVTDLTTPNVTNAKPGDVLSYTTTITNNTSNPATSVTFQDPIPGNTTYVPGSTILNGTAVPDVNGAMPFVNAAPVNSPGQPSGQIAANQAAVVIFQVKVNNPLPSNVTQISNQGTIGDNGFPPVKTGTAINTPFDPTVIPVTPPPGLANVRLVKRITNLTRNGAPINGVNFGSFVSVNTDDTAPGWPANFLLGVPTVQQTSSVQSGDEVEYTVYFLSDGGQDAQNVQFCDLIPSGTTFSPDSFSPGHGISLNRAGVVRFLTNAADADEGTFFASLAPLPAGNTCSNQNNPDGAVVVNLGTIPSTAGNNYGFVRFRTKIN